MHSQTATLEDRFIKLHHYSLKHYDAEKIGYDVKKNKVTYKYNSEISETTIEDWAQHLKGEKFVTVVPWKSAAEFKCIFGALDIDTYNDHSRLEKIAEKARKYKAIPNRTVSGGLHLYFYFNEPIPVAQVRNYLEYVRDELQLDRKTEMFPKQKKPTEKGNGIKAPCNGTTARGNARIGELYNFVENAEKNILTLEDIEKCVSNRPVKEKKEEDKALKELELELLVELGKDDEEGKVDNAIFNYIVKAVSDSVPNESIKEFLLKNVVRQHGTGRKFDTVEEYIDDKINRITEIYVPKTSFLLERIAYLAQIDQWFDIEKNQVYSERSINNQWQHLFQKNTPINYIRTKQNKTVVEDFIYEPKLYKKDSPIIQKNNLFYINKYKPLDLEPIPGDISLYDELVDHLFGSLTARTVFEDWVSYNYQYPGEKIKWALLITSKEFQVGKGSLFRAITETIGKDNSRKIDYREAVDKSKLYLRDRQIVLVDEMKSEGNFSEKEALLNTLKLIITEEEQSSRALFVDYKQIQTCTNIILYSNFNDALSLPENEVRYWVHNSYAPRLSEKFYQDFHKWLDGKGKNHLLNHFKTREISEDFYPKGVAPKTEHLILMSRLGGHPLVNQLRDRFEQQLEPFESDREIISSTWLFEWCKRQNLLGRSRINEIAKALDTIGAINVGQCPVQRAINTGQFRIHKPTLWIVRNKDFWKHKTLEQIGDHWANDPLNNGRGIDLFGGKFTEKELANEDKK